MGVPVNRFIYDSIQRAAHCKHITKSTIIYPFASILEWSHLSNVFVQSSSRVLPAALHQLSKMRVFVSLIRLVSESHREFILLYRAEPSLADKCVVDLKTICVRGRSEGAL